MGRPFDAPRPKADREPRRRFEVIGAPERVHSKFSMDVDRLRVRTPDGQESERLHVTFPKQATLTALTLDGTLVGSREHVYGTNGNNFEFSGGVRASDNTPQAAMDRVQDELGITARAASIVPLAVIRTDTGVYNITHQFLAEVETVGDQPDQPTISREDVPNSEIRARVLDGRIDTANIALQSLLIADHLEATRGEIGATTPKPLILPGGRSWMGKVPEPWKLEALEMRADENAVDQRGGLAVLERNIKTETDTEQLVHDRVRKPDGSKGEQFTVTYPRQTHVIPVDIESGMVYLPIEESYSYGEAIYTLPGSSLRDEESYGDAAKRVVQDEFGFEAGNNRLYNLGLWGETTSRFDYKTRIVGLNVKHEDMQERYNYVRISIENAWEAVKTGREIAEIKLDTLTPALAVGLLRHTQLQAVA